MKTKYLILIMLLAGGFIFQSCSKKDESAGYPSSTRVITGTVNYTVSSATNAAAGAIVYLKIGSKDVTTAYDATAVADANGKYKFSGLNKGDYFVRAEYTDSKGMKFTCTGSGVTLGANSGDCTADLNVQ